jgi:hypothetical protein
MRDGSTVTELAASTLLEYHFDGNKIRDIGLARGA